jgi:hypothetical protein
MAFGPRLLVKGQLPARKWKLGVAEVKDWFVDPNRIYIVSGLR